LKEAILAQEEEGAEAPQEEEEGTDVAIVDKVKNVFSATWQI